MFLFPPTIIFRHRKENLKKCSLKGLEKREDMLFLTYPKDVLPDLSNYILLTMDAPELCEKKDKEKGIFLIDATWRLFDKMWKSLPQEYLQNARSLTSNAKTAYPRKQEHQVDPNKGLASIEALYLAYKALNRDTSHLLDHYFWQKDFLQKNHLL